MTESVANNSGYADLHLHTNFSDGLLTPEQVVLESSRLGFSAIAITDHDILNGIEPAILAGEEHGLEVIPGVELSSEFNGEEVHILGYCMDWQDEKFRSRLVEFRDSRRIRAMKMVDKLNQLGVDIKYEDVLKHTESIAVGRPHVAAALVEIGEVNNISEAFRKFLHDDGPAYVSKHKLSPAEAIALILDVGGVPVIAHPGALQQDIISELVSCGLMGLEAFHPYHNPAISDYYCQFAESHGLLITGGSDCHGRMQDRMALGSIRLQYKHVVDLKKAGEDVLQQLKRASD